MRFHAYIKAILINYLIFKVNLTCRWFVSILVMLDKHYICLLISLYLIVTKKHDATHTLELISSIFDNSLHRNLMLYYLLFESMWLFYNALKGLNAQ